MLVGRFEPNKHPLGRGRDPMFESHGGVLVVCS